MPTPRVGPSTSHIVLARTPQTPLEQDPYFRALAGDPAWTLHHLPVLETSFTHDAELRRAVEVIHCSGQSAYDGVVITSARSIDAWRTAQLSLPSPLPLSSVFFFVVGQPTRSALLSVPSPPRSNLVLGADESGTGEKLASFILAHFRAASTLPRRRRLLYLTGDKNRDTLPRIVHEGSEGKIELDALQVYATQRTRTFEDDVEEILRGIIAEEDGKGDIWFALFSPSGAKECIAALRRRGVLPPSSRSPSPRPASASPAPSGPAAPRPSSALTTPAYSDLAPRIRLAAIGPVTQSYLEEQGLTVHAVAAKPEPEALVRAVREAS
ncbi:uroporphyrinogen-III synthase HEM4 [Rhodotorula paludigena]|uniref:uroporphyrinogen-III synthase HEM4 n=1 Tax=Rhodotorula paludigena TaxID=86838 RepID=UPI00317915D9